MISPSNACCTLQTQNKQEEKSYLLFVSYNMAKICIFHTQVSIFHEAMYTIRQNLNEIKISVINPKYFVWIGIFQIIPNFRWERLTSMTIKANTYGMFDISRWITCSRKSGPWCQRRKSRIKGRRSEAHWAENFQNLNLS